MFSTISKWLEEKPAPQLPSIISADLNILGNLIGEGHIDIAGKIDGNVRAGTVTVREGGQVRGDITAEAAHIYGNVHGLIRAKHVALYRAAKVDGIIMHETLSMEDGASLDGQCKRIGQEGADEWSKQETLLPEMEEFQPLRVIPGGGN